MKPVIVLGVRDNRGLSHSFESAPFFVFVKRGDLSNPLVRRSDSSCHFLHQPNSSTALEAILRP